MGYLPRKLNIIAVSLAPNAVVQTEEDHDFIPGNTVTFIIPNDFNMVELNGLDALVLAVDDTDTVTVNINTLKFTPFVVPAEFFTPAQLLPLGDVNTGFQGPTANNPLGVPGAFRVTR